MSDIRISYRKVRDLGAVFSATFAFIRNNFRAFFGALLLFAGPFLIISSMLSSYMFGSLFAFRNVALYGSTAFDFKSLISSYVIAVLVSLIGLSVYNAMVNKALIENEQLHAEDKLQFRDMARSF